MFVLFCCVLKYFSFILRLNYKIIASRFHLTHGFVRVCVLFLLLRTKITLLSTNRSSNIRERWPDVWD